MSVYLVRRIDDQGILGIFWGTKEQVIDIIDEVADPVDFEAHKLFASAIYCEESTEPKWPQDEMRYSREERRKLAKDFRRYTPSEWLAGVLADQEGYDWEPVKRWIDTRWD